MGGAEADQLAGGAGDDTLDGGAGVDVLDGGADNDTYLNVTGEDTIFDIEGNNTIVLATAAGLGAAGLSSTLQTDANGGQYPQLSITLDNGEVLKLNSAYFSTGSTTLQFANGEVQDVEALVGETLTTPLNLQLGDAGGRVYGGAGGDTLSGGAGVDTLLGYGGDDSLYGNAGNDTLDGGAGDGYLNGGAGDDSYRSVTGEDTVYDNAGHNTIILATATGLGAAGLSSTLQPDANGGQYAQLAVTLDNGEVLKLNSPYFSTGSTTLQFATGETLDVEALVGEQLATPALSYHRR